MQLIRMYYFSFFFDFFFVIGENILCRVLSCLVFSWSTMNCLVLYINVWCVMLTVHKICAMYKLLWYVIMISCGHVLGCKLCVDFYDHECAKIYGLQDVHVVFCVSCNYNISGVLSCSVLIKHILYEIVLFRFILFL